MSVRHLPPPLDKRQKQQAGTEEANSRWVAIFTEKGMPVARISSSTAQNLANLGWPFSFEQKKRLRQDFPAATGLVKSWVVILTGKKCPRQDFPAATGLVRSRPKSALAQKHKVWPELGPESTVWAENQSKWIIRAVRTRPDHSQDSGRRPRPNFPTPGTEVQSD